MNILLIIGLTFAALCWLVARAHRLLGDVCLEGPLARKLSVALLRKLALYSLRIQSGSVQRFL